MQDTFFFLLALFGLLTKLFESFQVSSNTETLAVLNSGLVDRIGHGTFIHSDTGGSEELHTVVRKQNLPLGKSFPIPYMLYYTSTELCFSSNIKLGTVKNASHHHLGFWKKENHPVVICTDDKGVFATSLSEEFFLCAQTFHLTEGELHSLCLSGVDAAFLSQVEKQRLRQEVQKELDSLKGKLACQ
ncbi:Adenosine deaminase-like protein [Portunus trituberculatus]|uniref:Adenosine deaminase-like protein n=1 Tax=Portunus trituberculatus TaxID=210409 RepID=A0A5B7F415_PORTR|nr:Adenosine deaminase-like protein [Portunus trituberculatus]